MTQHNVESLAIIAVISRSSETLESIDFNIAIVVNAALSRIVVRRQFKPSLSMILRLVNPANASYTYPPVVHDPRRSQIVNVGSDPTTIIQFGKGLPGFVVAANNNGQEGRFQFTRVILVKRPKFAELRRLIDGVQVSWCTQRLKVPATKQQIKLSVLSSEALVKGTDSSMAVAVNGDS